MKVDKGERGVGEERERGGERERGRGTEGQEAEMDGWDDGVMGKQSKSHEQATSFLRSSAENLGSSVI